MTAQCFQFFVAGFDTSSLILSSTLLELALNRHVQNKLHEEIDNYLQKNNNEITYEIIQRMPYLHKVVQGNVLINLHSRYSLHEEVFCGIQDFIAENF